MEASYCVAVTYKAVIHNAIVMLVGYNAVVRHWKPLDLGINSFTERIEVIFNVKEQIVGIQLVVVAVQEVNISFLGWYALFIL